MYKDSGFEVMISEKSTIKRSVVSFDKSRMESIEESCG